MKRLLTIFFLSLPMMLAAQNDVAVSTDRPTMCAAPYLVPQKHLQLEAGVECGWDNGHNITLPATMLRYGLTRFAEVRLQYAGVLGQSAGSWNYNASQLALGTKLKITDGNNWIPQISFLANLVIPCTKTMHETMHVAPQAYLLFQNDITSKFSVCYNLGAEWNGVNATPSTFLAVCPSYSVTDKIGVFVENYNYFTTELNQSCEVSSNLDFGLTWQVKSALQLDVYSGFNLNHFGNTPFVGVGVGWQIL